MGTVLRMNELNQLEKGTVLFKKGEPIRCIGAIIRGSIRILGEGICRTAKQGVVAALPDLFFNKYLGDYIVEEDTLFYAFPIKNTEVLDGFLNDNADYRGIVVHSMAIDLAEYLKERENLIKLTSNIRELFKDDLMNEVKEDMFELGCSEKLLANYQEYANVPLEIHKKYYYNSQVMALYQADEIASVIREILKSCQEVINYLDEIYLDMADEHLYDKKVSFDRKYLTDKFIALLNEKKAKAETAQEEEDNAPIENPMEALKNSLQQILKFAKVEEAKRKDITALMNEFLDFSDKMSTQDDLRKVKKKITDFFFPLYETCVFKWFENKNVPLAVKLFLNYGYIDERLLDEEQIVLLCENVNTKYPGLACPIYTMPEWLKEIYEGRKEPSRNSFEQDYRDFLREKKRTGDITEKQEKELLEDNVKKVKFEIENMFISNNKIVNGKLSTYVPILYKDEIYGHLERLYLTKKQLCDTIIELEKKDFTVFQREVLYTNPELNIEKEYVLKRVYPDVIMAPVYGTASSMWQEITGKKRDSPGRFIFPVITENEIDKLVTKAFGRLHWEYCRCEQGASWNNIQYKSLTSEYMDYIQYYRKNPSLTEEKREKVKAQILKARNNSREIFLIDYELWIYYESKAAMKLNKVARLILGEYCPFNKEIREVLKTNAAFEEPLMRFQKKFGEKKREWEMRIKRRENKNLEVPKEFYDTYEYYANN